jgi:PAT family beta-lactamase induction signal transducer AmpG
LLLAICFAAIALAVPSNHFLILTLAALFVGAFVSSTHDIALDGFYMLGLPQEKQSFFSGIRNTFYRIATVFSSGFLVMLANKLGHHFGNDAIAWSATFAVTGTIMLVLWLYHTKAIPRPESDTARTTKSIKSAFHNYGDIIKSYFQKPGIWQALLFLLLFRFPEAQLAKLGKLFLMDEAAKGGLALDKGEIGFIYGVLGVIGLIIGGIAGGICISRKGLKYWLWPMVIAISLPDAVYIYI